MADPTKNRVVRMSTAMTGDNFSFAAGDLVECPADVADRFIEKGVASAAPADAKATHVYVPGPSPKAKAEAEAAKKAEEKAAGRRRNGN